MAGCLGSWVAASLVLFVIWLISGTSGGPWFLGVALALGAVLLARRITGTPARRGHNTTRPPRNHRHLHHQAGQ